MDDRKQRFFKEASKLEHQGKIEAKKAQIEGQKEKIKEAKEHAERARAEDGGTISLPLPAAEVVRTETLVRQEEEILKKMEGELEQIEKEEPTEYSTPVEEEVDKRVKKTA